MSTNGESAAPDRTLTVRTRRRTILAVVLTAALGVGIFLGRASALSDGGPSRQQLETTQLDLGDLRDPAAALHRRIYAIVTE